MNSSDHEAEFAGASIPRLKLEATVLDGDEMLVVYFKGRFLMRLRHLFDADRFLTAVVFEDFSTELRNVAPKRASLMIAESVAFITRLRPIIEDRHLYERLVSIALLRAGGISLGLPLDRIA